MKARLNAQSYMYFAMDAGKGGDKEDSGKDSEAADKAERDAARRK